MTPEEFKKAISMAEGTSLNVSGGKGYESPYDVTLAYGAFDPYKKPVSQMTLKELDEFQLGMLKNPNNNLNSSAAGKYQITRQNMDFLKKKLKLSEDTIFSPELQDQLADVLLERRGLSRFLKGELSAEDFQNNLSKEWASLAPYGKDKPSDLGFGTKELQQMLLGLKGEPVDWDALGFSLEPERPEDFNFDLARATAVDRANSVGYEFADLDELMSGEKAIERQMSTVPEMGFEDFGIEYKPIDLPYPDQPQIGGQYTVKSGDTLYSISQRTGVPVEELAKRNNIMNNMIFPGQRLMY